MVPFFVQIKCQLGKSYEVANRLADAEIASEIYSTAGEFDLMSVGRGQIADAEWVHKVRDGRFSDLRPFVRADVRSQAEP